VILTVLVSGAQGAAYADGSNGSLAFTRGFQPDPDQPGHAEVWTVSSDGSDQQRLFGAGIEENSWPAWSPDGRSLAFFRDHRLVVARVDGSESHEVAEGGGFVVSWSPDGTRLVFSIGGDHDNAIWVSNADGSDAHIIHTGPEAEMPDWSPRGDRIVFAERPDSGMNLRSALFTMDIDGGDVRRLNDGSAPYEYSSEQWPTWSPDGSRIAFVRDQAPSFTCGIPCWTTSYDIHLVNADGTGLVRLHEDGAEWFPPSWSPDGTSLAYSWMPATTTGPAELHVRSLLTGAVTTLVRDVGDAVDWGPAPGSMAQADLSARLSADATSVLPGAPVTLTAAVRNAGPGTASGASVELRPAPGSDFDLAASPGCVAASGGAARCAFGDLPSGETATVSLRTRAGAPGVGEASALATSLTVDPHTEDNRATLSVAVCTQLGSAGRDRLRGTGGDDVLCGGPGDDVLTGEDGDDVLVGGPGRDHLEGGVGKDTASYAQSRARVRVDLGAGRADGDGRDRLSLIENAVGSRFADRLSGSTQANALSGGPGADVFAPGGGADRVSGGLGRDRLDYRNARRAVRLDLDARRGSGDGRVRWTSVEGAVGSPFADRITGSVAADLVSAGDGDDVIEALGGDDRVVGGPGADLLRGGDGNDRLSGGAGVDRCSQDFGKGFAKECERRR